MKTLLTLLFIPALLATAQNAAPGTRNALEQTAAPTPGLDDSSLVADSPKTFPRKGPLPLLYPPNLPMRDEESEVDYFIFSAPLEPGTPMGQVPAEVPAPSRYPGRTLEQITRIEFEMPQGTFTAPLNDWQHLARTRRLLTEGGDLHILALGDSIINDTVRSGWVAKLQQAYPKVRIKLTVYIRGGGGCHHFKEEGRVQKYILPRQPDLIHIGGISQKDIASIREVIQQIRAGLPDVEFLLTSGVFGRVDLRDPAKLALAPHSGTGAYGQSLRQLAKDERCAYLDMTRSWAAYLVSSKQHPHVFYRDRVHANEFGEQVLSRILMAYFKP
jgi:hypothetical protein